MNGSTISTSQPAAPTANSGPTTEASPPAHRKRGRKPGQLVRPRRAPYRSRNAEGAEVIMVPLARGEKAARVNPEDFDRLMAIGLSPAWTLNSNGSRGFAYVRGKMNQGRVTIARLIMHAGPGDRVSYRDGDPTNLRRDNLYFSRQRTYWRHLPGYLHREGSPQQPLSAR